MVFRDILPPVAEQRSYRSGAWRPASHFCGNKSTTCLTTPAKQGNMLPGTLLHQIYAGNPSCGEMRNTKQDSVTGPDCRSYGNMCARIS